MYEGVCVYKIHMGAAAAESLQSCPTLCNPIDSSPPGSPVPGILQARTLEWGAISFSNAWQWKVKVKSLSRVRLLATPWTAAYQAPPSVGFSRQEYWSGVPLPSQLHLNPSGYTQCKCFPITWGLPALPQSGTTWGHGKKKSWYKVALACRAQTPKRDFLRNAKH